MIDRDDEPTSDGPRRPLPFTIFAAGAWSLVALITFFFAVEVLLSLRPGAKDDLVSLYACQAIAYLLVVFAILRLHAPDASIRDFLGVRPTNFWFLPIAAALGVVVRPAVDASYELLNRRWPVPPDDLDVQFASSALRDKVLIGVVLIALGPILEEILFRGALFQAVKKSSRAAVVVGTSFFFAVAHMHWQFWAPLFVVALVFGLLRLESGSLVAPVLMHAAYNASAFAELVYPPKDEHAIPWRTVVVATLVAAALIGLVVQLGRRSRAAMVAQEMDKL